MHNMLAMAARFSICATLGPHQPKEEAAARAEKDIPAPNISLTGFIIQCFELEDRQYGIYLKYS